MIATRTFFLAILMTLFTLGHAAPASSDPSLARRQDFNFSPLGVANPEGAPPSSNNAAQPPAQPPSNTQNPPPTGGTPSTTEPSSPPANPANSENPPPAGPNPPESNSDSVVAPNPPSNGGSGGTYQPPKYYNPGYGEHGYQGSRHHNYRYN
ncbi:hypothetical protein NP233_g1823 [Leucocoprinus birnbaumii]|uniref:Uncharacterized protein n=1 Tax=Leucocoprinus birnbaumii TaxID=56174 RepID=A0AAD5W071_9AGAR|nr:hypothetical protein NP233_g1823 [Leucocoprinus birnbaumii]